MFRKFICAVFVLASFRAGAFPNPARSTRAGLDLVSYLSFNPSTSNFDLQQNIYIQAPDPAKYGPGPYPVFFWTPATFQIYLDPMSLRFVNEMADRGFLAASVQYSNTNGAQQTCKAYTQRAQGVFDAARTTSAVTTVCSLENADCPAGVVTAGFSQGAALALLARNYAPAVKAAYIMSMGSKNGTGIGIDLSACLGKQNTALPADRIVIVNGQGDPSFGSQASTQGASGFACPSGSFQCWNSAGNGAGWYIVKNTQTKDGSADHCYMDVGGCNDQYDASWTVPATYNWSLKPNLDWLATFGTYRVFSADGQ